VVFPFPFAPLRTVLATFKAHGSPVPGNLWDSAIGITPTSSLHVPVNLSPFAVCPAFPDSDYYGDSVTMGLAPFRRSCDFLPSYVLA
jgi:hypothetical protein